MPAWMRKKSEPKKVETPTTTDATSNDANKAQNSQQSNQSNLFQNQGANKVTSTKIEHDLIIPLSIQPPNFYLLKYWLK